ncbi:MAG: phage protein [Victivallaceae bacterium]|nr:phage protein [Victivallaceae bacterium]
MNKQRFNGMSFDLDLGVTALKVQKCTLDITDNTTVAKRNGRPDGYLPGDVSAAGTITVDRDGLAALTEQAKSAGYWQGIEPFDICTYAKVGDDELKIEAFGCKVKISKLLDIDKSKTDETLFEIPYDVTSPDFVNINGVPYLEPITE